MPREYIKTDERNHVEEPFLQQLLAMENFGKDKLYWDVLHLEKSQQPAQTGRKSFEEVVMKDKLREALRTINPWMNIRQIAEAVEKITSFPGRNLITENQELLELLIKGGTVDSEKDKEDQLYYFIDFDHPENNNYTAVSQLKVRIPGTENYFYPDIVCFVNGLPLVVIECKSPKIQTPIEDAIDQMMRYAEQRGEENEGNKRLFIYNQILIATCRNKAKFGTITTPSENLFFRWTDPYPATLDELTNYIRPTQADYFVNPDGTENEAQHLRTAPNDQQRMVHGMLYPRNLLNLIRTFTIFSCTEKGETIKIVGRYQQYRAVYKALERIRNGNSPKERGGLIWHTQGSGKSLTMLFLIREMWRHPLSMDYKFVILTDRTQLDDQIHKTINRSGYPIERIENVEDAKRILKQGAFAAVTVMIQKFQERDKDIFISEALNNDEKIIVLTDEAHRSQFGKLAANFNNALPHAINIGFTGTPTTKTEETFGDYIDKYTMQQSIEDGVTLEIVYEGRTENSQLSDIEAANKAFKDVFKDVNFNEYGEILNESQHLAYMEAEPTIRAKAHDMFRHYLSEIMPNGFKAQVVTSSVEAAHRYKLAFDREIAAAQQELTECLEEQATPTLEIRQHDNLAYIEEKRLNYVARQKSPEYQTPFRRLIRNINPEWLENLKAEVIISPQDINKKPYLKNYPQGKKQKKIIESFKLGYGSKADNDMTGDVGILIVVNMLTVGFDAPIEQVMYLDKIAVMHNLLQTITRVNRPGSPAKKYGFVVDYVGIGDHILDALKYYKDKDQQDIKSSLKDTASLEKELQEAIKKTHDFFRNHQVYDLNDLDAIYNLFYNEELRTAFILLFRAVTSAINNLYPRKEALKYQNDYNQLAEISVKAALHTRDERLKLRGIPAKLRKILDEYLETRGIEQKVEPISITDEDFAKEVEQHASKKTQAAEIEHAIRHYINIHIDEDREQFLNFSDMLELILRESKDRWEEIISRLNVLREQIKNRHKENTYGLDVKKQMPYFRKLKNNIFNKDHALTEDEAGCLVAVTIEICEKIDLESHAFGFWTNPASQEALRGELLKILLAKEHQLYLIPGCFENRNTIVDRLLEEARPH